MPTATPITIYQIGEQDDKLVKFIDVKGLDDEVISKFKGKIYHDLNWSIVYDKNGDLALDGSYKEIPVDFFSKSLGELENVELPIVVFQPLGSPKESDVIPSRFINQKQYQVIDSDKVKVTNPPVWFDVDYQVTSLSNTWEVSRKLISIISDQIFPVVRGQRYGDIFGTSRPITIQSLTSSELPEKRIFQNVASFTLTLPIKIEDDYHALRNTTLENTISSDSGLHESSSITLFTEVSVTLTFVGLTDTPDALVAGEIFRTNTDGDELESIPAGNSGYLLYDNGTRWQSNSPDSIGLVDKTTPQNITSIKTFTSGIVTTSQIGVEIKPYGSNAGETGEIRFRELDANGSNYISFHAADNMASSVTYTFPASAPTVNGQLLSSQTDGTLSWITVNTSISIGDKIVSGTSKSILYINASGNLSENENLVFDYSSNQIRSVNIHIDGDITNYDSTKPDMGFIQNSDKYGYGNNYIDSKDLCYCSVGFNDIEGDGNIRTTSSGEFQHYSNGSYNVIVTGFRLRETSDDGLSFEHKPIGFENWIEISTGNSVNKGLNGLPITQNYNTSMGAYPVRQSVFGGNLG